MSEHYLIRHPLRRRERFEIIDKATGRTVYSTATHGEAITAQTRLEQALAGKAGR